jgi:4-amino-4-deoxy-L-arabinose transferase-like glycosyltransferase
MPRHHPLSRIASVLVVSLFALVWFAILAPRHLAKTDEGRYAEIPREMVVSGDWITPRLDGLLYFEKPALQYWATAAAFEVFGPSEWATRLWTGLTGFLGVLVIAYTTRRLYGGASGFYAAAVLASSLLYLLMGHVATLDMGVTFFMTAGLCAALLARQSNASTQARGWMLLSWALFGLAVLSKGLEGIVLPGLVLILYLVTTRDATFASRLEPWRGPLVFLAVTAPWFVLVALRNPDFAHFFFIHEHFERFLTTSHHREGPWWYFIPILAVGLVPWIFVLPGALAWAQRETHLPSQSSNGRFMPGRLLLIWSAAIFLFFSFSASKLPSYILPIFPALAMLIGAYLAQAEQRLFTWLALASLGVACALLGLSWAGLSWVTPVPADEAQAYAEFGHGLAIAGALWVLASITALWLVLRGRLRASLAVIAAGSIAAASTGLVAYGALDRFASAQYVAAALAGVLTDDTPLYSVEQYEQTLPFYLGRTLILVNQRDELDFGLKEQPERGIASLAAFAIRWMAEPKGVAIMPPSTFDKLQAMKLPMRVILKDRRFVVVSKP